MRDCHEKTPPCPTLPKLCLPLAFPLASRVHPKLRSTTQFSALLSEPTCSYQGCTTCSRMNLCLKSPSSLLTVRKQSMHNAQCLSQKPHSPIASKPKPRYVSATFSMQLKDMINKVVLISSKHHPTFHSYIFSQLRVPQNKHQFCLKIKSLNALSEQGMERLRLILHTSTLHGAQILQKKVLKFTEGVPCSA